MGRPGRLIVACISRGSLSQEAPITNAETGTFHITVPNSTEVTDYGSYDTRTIDKDITAVMAVTFRVE